MQIIFLGRRIWMSLISSSSCPLLSFFGAGDEGSGRPCVLVHPRSLNFFLTSATGIFLLGETPYSTLAPSLTAKETMSIASVDLPERGGAEHMIGAIGGLVKKRSASSSRCFGLAMSA